MGTFLFCVVEVITLRCQAKQGKCALRAVEFPMHNLR